MYTCTGASPSALASCGLPPARSLTGLAFAFAFAFAGAAPLSAAAAFTSALNAPASISSPSWMSIALRVLPSKLELKRRDGSGIRAPRAKVSFTAFAYASPVQTIPWCDQTGVPHFHSSVISGSASRINARMRARVSPRHPARSRIRRSMSREADSPPETLSPLRRLVDVAFAAFGGDLDLGRLRVLCACDLLLTFGFDLPTAVESVPACSIDVAPSPVACVGSTRCARSLATRIRQHGSKPDDIAHPRGSRDPGPLFLDDDPASALSAQEDPVTRSGERSDRVGRV